MPTRPSLPYRLVVKVLLRDVEGNYLFLRRSGAPGHSAGCWEMPGGKVDPGETLDEALLREVRKETGLTVRLGRVVGAIDGEASANRLIYVFIEGASVSREVTLSPVHCEARWMALSEALSEIEAFCPQYREMLLNFAREKGYGPAPGKDPGPGENPLSKLGKQVENYRQAQPRFEALAKTLTDILRKASARVCPLALVDARAKAVTSFAEKILRKSKYLDPLREITDLCGVRVVTHLQTEVEAMCAYIRASFHIDERNSVDTLTRLGRAEFGYRSVHYVVQIDREKFPGLDADLYERKAEIQVRTMLQHAWSDIGHDRLYKGGFLVPARWEREAARIAATLESADQAFGRMIDGLEGYRSDYGAFLTPEKLRTQLDTTAALRGHDPANVVLVEREARQALAAGDWQRAASVAGDYAGLRPSTLDCCQGQALCRLHSENREGAEFARGIALLRSAAAADPRSAEPRLHLAEWEQDSAERLRIFEAAYAAEPEDPETLAAVIGEKIVSARDAGFAALVGPSLEAAIHRCELQIEAGLDAPRAYLRIARFQLLLRREWEALDALAHAVRTAENREALAQALDEAAVESTVLAELEPDREDAVAFRLFALLLRHAVKPDESSLAALREVATESAPLQSPIVILAGGCDPSLESEMQKYRRLIFDGFANFRGTILSGGTREGVSGLVGELSAASKRRIQAVGYLPKSVPGDGTAHEDGRYLELRRTTGRRGFSALEPLQSWIDLIVNGVSPESVRLVGINGGRIASIEYRIAWALGATVAVVRESGREADRMERAIKAGGLKGVLVFPSDVATVAAFLSAGSDGKAISQTQVDGLARLVHAEFLAKNRHKHPDLAMRPWEHLEEDLRDSNRDVARFMIGNLELSGFAVVDGSDPRADADLTKFTKEVEQMAEREHGRWNVERLGKGWRFESHRDPEKKLSPYLVGWKALEDGVKKWDRENVLRYPALLAQLGLRVVWATAPQ